MPAGAEASRWVPMPGAGEGLGFSRHLPSSDDLFEAYRAGGASGVSRLVRNYVLSLLAEAYARCGLPFDGEVSFSRLADAGAISEDTAVYLTATYMALDNLMEDLEEAEAMCCGEEARRVLEEVALKLQELADALLGCGGQGGAGRGGAGVPGV